MKVGDYVAYKFRYTKTNGTQGCRMKTPYRGKIIDKKTTVDGLGNFFNIFFVRYINGLEVWELEEDLIEIDWLLVSL